jgi:hypothetical protein
MALCSNAVRSHTAPILHVASSRTCLISCVPQTACSVQPSALRAADPFLTRLMKRPSTVTAVWLNRRDTSSRATSIPPRRITTHSARRRDNPPAAAAAFDRPAAQYRVTIRCAVRLRDNIGTRHLPWERRRIRKCVIRVAPQTPNTTSAAATRPPILGSPSASSRATPIARSRAAPIHRGVRSVSLERVTRTLARRTGIVVIATPMARAQLSLIGAITPELYAAHRIRGLAAERRASAVEAAALPVGNAHGIRWLRAEAVFARHLSPHRCPRCLRRP